MNKIFTLLLLAIVYASAFAQRIAVLNDLHVSPGNDNSLWLQRAINEINTANYDCVVVNGDLTNEGSDAELDYIYSLLQGIRHKIYTVPGNHENNWSQSATTKFIELWGDDRFATDIDGLVIVGINCGPYMKMGDGHIKQEDLHWLHATLDSLVTHSSRVLSFNHYPVRADDIDNYADYLALLEQYPVLAHLNGHYHRWADYKMGDITGVMTRALALDGTFGYSVVEVRDSVIDISEKIIGGDLTHKYHINGKRGHTPSGASDRVPIMSPEGFEVTCLHADSASVFTRLAFDDNNIYFGTSTGYAKAIDKATGSERWSRQLGASLFSRPVVVSDGVVAFPHAHGIALIAADDGSILTDHESATPYVADGLRVDGLYLQGGYKRFECRDYEGLKWSYDSIGNYCQGAPAVSGDNVVFGAWDTFLRCLDITDGSLRWQWSNGKSNNLFSPGNVVPVVAGDRVIIVAPDRYMTAIDLATGTTLWRDNSYRYRESLGHSADGSKVYAKTMDGELVAVDAAADSCQVSWVCDMGIGYDHAPCIVAEADGVVYAGSRRGILTAIDAATHSLLWQLPLGLSEINGIDLDDSVIYLSLIEGAIWRIVKNNAD